MTARAKKLDAIFNFCVMTGQNPWFAFLTGFLIGQVDRVHFLSDLTDAEIAISINIRKTKVWPQEPFKASVRGINMPNTLTLARAIESDDAPICVSFDFDHSEDTEWYQEVVLPNVSYVKDAPAAAQEQSEALWKEIDRSLDIYRECKSRLKNADPERRRELSYYMRLAEEQMKVLSAQMDALNKHMKRISEDEQ